MFSPRSSNHRFCGQLECPRLLRRWQDAKRQRRFRSREENREQHAAAERQRRRRQREARATTVNVEPPQSPVAPEQTPRAWSRSEKILHDFCDRPGCYDPLRGARRGPAQYCVGDCGQAERRVQDRERKFKARQQKTAAAMEQEREQTPPAAARRTISAEEWKRYREVAERSAARVRTSPPPAIEALSSRDRTELPDIPEEVSKDDPETSPGHRPRAPPSGGGFFLG